MAMALALVKETRILFSVVTMGRKEISPTKLNTTGNRGASSRMAWTSSCTKSNGNQPQQAGSQPTEGHFDVVTGALLGPRLQVSSQYLSLSCPWSSTMHERKASPGEKSREHGQGKARLCFFMGCCGFMLPSNRHLSC